MKLQKKVIDLLKSKGAWCIKTVVVNERGCPDILACVNGKFWGIEIKSGGDKLSPIQHEQLCRIIEAGGVGIVVASDFATPLWKHIHKLNEQRNGDEEVQQHCYESFARELHYACID